MRVLIINRRVHLCFYKEVFSIFKPASIWQQVQPRSPDAVKLIGEEGFELAADLPETVKTELAWASYLLLTNTVTRSLVVYYQGKVLLRRGILAPKAEVTPGPIVKRVLAKQQPVYLVALNVYPGRKSI